MVKLSGLVTGVLLCAAFAFTFISVSLAQSLMLGASTDRTTLRENESLTLTLRIEGALREEPDFSSLEQDFDILRRASNVRVQIVGGRTSRVTEWVLQLMPLRSGRLTIPALEVEGVRSGSIGLDVLPAPDTVVAADIFVEVEVDTDEPYVQAQVLYTLRLYSAVTTGRATLSAPEIIAGDAIVERLTDDREYDTILGGRSFRVRERRYGIFPQSTGTVTIGPVTFEATIVPTRGMARVQRARSNEIELQVRNAVPPPPRWSDAVWLPARNLTLSEQWQDSARDLFVGVPRTRTVVIEADGLQEAQLPDLTVRGSEMLRHFAGQPVMTREYTEAGLRARRQQPFAVMAQAPGAAYLAEIELPWWNVTTHSWDVARIAPAALEVQPSREPVPLMPGITAETEAAVSTNGRSAWPLISGALLVGWVATVALLWRLYVRGDGRRPAPFLAPPRRAANRRLLIALRGACARADAPDARRLLLEWAALRFPEDPPSTLGALAARVPADLAVPIRTLEAHQYGRHDGGWDGGPLARALSGLDSIAHTARSGRDDPLLPLYR